LFNKVGFGHGLFDFLWLSSLGWHGLNPQQRKHPCIATLNENCCSFRFIRTKQNTLSLFLYHRLQRTG
jgi:hypothetical protein